MGRMKVIEKIDFWTDFFSSIEELSSLLSSLFSLFAESVNQIPIFESNFLEQ